MKWYGLTGGIGSGKSTVSQMLRDHGLAVVDADEIAKNLTRTGSPIFCQLVKFFGQEIVSENGELDRALLGKIVFKNFDKKKYLEDLLHPQIQAEVLKERQHLQAIGKNFAFYDVPLLFEKNLKGQFDGVITVSCGPEQQFQRIKLRNPHLNDEEINDRICSQIPISEKVKMSDYVIDNSGDLGALRKQVELVIHEIGTNF